MNIVSLTTRSQTAALVASSPSGELVTFRRDATDWLAAPQLVGELFNECGLRLAEWLRSGRATIVKDGVHRTVYRLELASGCYYLKHYRAPRLRNLLLNLVRPCRAVLERNASCRVAEQGVPTYETVAIGRRRVGPIVSDSYLITRAIENTVPLDELVRDGHDRSSCPLPPALRQSLAVKLGQLVARLHAGGLVHRDMHAGNVLVRIIADDDIRLWLIDPAPMSRRANMNLRAIQSNLALLNNSLASLTTPADRCRFFRAYWHAVRSLDGRRFSARLAEHFNPPRDIVERVENYCARALQACHRKNDRKWVTGNRRLIIADAATRQCRAVAGVGKEQIVQIRDNPDSLFAEDRVQTWHHRSAVQSVAFVDACIDGKQATCCATTIEAAVTAGRRRGESAARRVWEGGHALLRRSLDCPRPLLFVVPAAGDDAGRQYLLTETLPNAVRLSDILKSQAGPRENAACERFLRSCVARLASRVRAMHASGVDHESLSAESVLVDTSSECCEIAFWQLEAVRLRRSVSRRHAVAALALLDTSVERIRPMRHTHRVRFLRRYLKNRFRSGWKSYWREIAAAAIRLPADVPRAEPFPYYGRRSRALT